MLTGVTFFSIFINYVMRDGDLSNEPEEIIEGMDDKERDLIKSTRTKLEHIRYKQTLNGRCSLHFEELINKQRTLDLSKENDLIQKLQDKQKKNEVYESIWNYFKKFCNFMNQIDLEVFVELYGGLKQMSYCINDKIVSRGDEAKHF